MIQMPRTIFAYAIAFFALIGATSARTAELSIAPAPTAFEARFVTLTNSERAMRGVNPLVWDPTLCHAGRQHSQEMAELSYFDHQSPIRGLETPADRWERYNSTVPNEYTIGENLFYGSVTDVNWGHRSLMASAEHRANIVNPTFARMGVGVFVSSDGQMWVTEMFVS
jgi:uncharacterized protein YkwD